MRSLSLLAAFFVLPAAFAASTGVAQGLEVGHPNEDLVSRASCNPKCTLHQTCTARSRCVFQGRNCNLTVYEGDGYLHTHNLPDAQFQLYYAGSGYSLNSYNPGNDFGGDNPTTTFNAALTPCAAAQKCSDFCRGTDPDIYNSQWSFALYYRYSLKKWQCVGYLYSNNPRSEGGSGNDPPSFWNVPDKDVEVGYGYSYGDAYGNG